MKFYTSEPGLEKSWDNVQKMVSIINDIQSRQPLSHTQEVQSAKVQKQAWSSSRLLFIIKFPPLFNVCVRKLTFCSALWLSCVMLHRSPSCWWLYSVYLFLCSSNAVELLTKPTGMKCWMERCHLPAALWGQAGVLTDGLRLVRSHQGASWNQKGKVFKMRVGFIFPLKALQMHQCRQAWWTEAES